MMETDTSRGVHGTETGMNSLQTRTAVVLPGEQCIEGTEVTADGSY
jgi:hypothetical protein